MKIILGLGNPGERYASTRHNVGFRVAHELARRAGAVLDEDQCRSDTLRLSGVLLAAPRTFMNRSGYAARCLLERHGLESTDLLVVYDEVHLPLGTLRLRTKGSPAGHRGLESVLENLGTDEVPRLRLGVGPRDGDPPAALADFVLGDFDDAELAGAEQMIERAAEACELWIGAGADAAMQRFNGPPPAAESPEAGDAGG